ncbi:hypothetical protein [Sinanaerobacter sp. ZZT-01]|uniref:hypothetical protein n=1 Tax=Sinanaerobacter sp. ZZT-01 TaxID=3111540 RepID=UPI002D766AE5|nr:hypothetical protein [Sinanaerobacter sp. ZZT-01]WRR94920.1 hypothetical protein U5921_07310 [Sinanaerobacter sp. ZZT-01]
MNEDIQRELKAVEKIGNQIARKFILQKFVLLFVALFAILTSIKLYSVQVYLLVELVILWLVLRFIRKNQIKFQTALYEKCDPYLQFTVIDYYKNHWRIIPKNVKNQLLIAMAQCMLLAGEPQEAISISNKIENPSRMRVAYQAIYYNNLLNAYGQFCWDSKRFDLVNEIKKLKERCRKKDAMYLDVILRLEELHMHRANLDLDFVKKYFEKNPAQHQFQKVAMHYYIAEILLKSGKKEEAEESISFVREYGNKLYYKKELVKLIQRV